MHLHPPIRRSFRPFPIWESTNDCFSHSVRTVYKITAPEKLFEIFTKYICNTLISRGATYNYKGAYRPTMGGPMPRRPAGWKKSAGSAENLQKKVYRKKKKKITETQVRSAREPSHIAFPGGPAFRQYSPAGEIFRLLLPTAARTCKKSLKSPR